MLVKMDFFSQLRRLSVVVEQEVDDLQTSLNTLVKPDQTPPDGSTAYLTLKKIQEDVKKLKSDMFATLHQLKETKDFISNVDHYVEKMKNQQKQIDELEAYLVKYGYQPLPKAAVLPEQKQCADKDKADEVDNGEDLGSMAEKHKPSPSSNLVQPCRRGSNSPPRLEDFGLSWETLDKYGAKAEQHQQQQDSEGFLIPQLPTAAKSQVQTPLSTWTSSSSNIPQKWTSAESLPDDFKHHGLCVTPGMVGGSMPPNCTPGTSVEYSMMSLDTTTAPEGLGVDSPIPPVLTTPGIKQIEHLPTARYVQTPSKKDLDDSDSSPFPPTFVTPGLKPLPRIDRQPLPSEVPVLAYDDEDEEDKSPVPPVLKTPGAKQIGKPGVIQPTSGISSDDPNSGTPQSPNLMLNYQDVFPLPSNVHALQPPSSVEAHLTTAASLASQTTASVSAKAADLQGAAVNNDPTAPTGAKSRTLDPPSRASSLSVDGLEEPQMPELTGTYSFSFKDLCPQTMPLTERSNTRPNDKPASSNQSRVSQEICDEGFDSTILELSGKHAIGKATGTGTVKSGTVSPLPAAPVLNLQCASTPEMPDLSWKYKAAYDKENVAMTMSKPEAELNKKSGKASPELEKSPSFCLKHISEQQFMTLPDYVQRCISLERCNSTLSQLQQLIESRQKEGISNGMYLCDADLEQILQGKTTAFIMIMMKLSRLEKVNCGSGLSAYLLS